MMAKNHPSSLLGLGEEKRLGVAGLCRGGFALASTQHRWGTEPRVSS